MRIAIAFVAVAIFASSAARAETMDVAKVTCGELGNYYLEEVVVVGAWLSGYYNAKQNNTVIDSKKIEENTAKVMLHCRTNPQETVMHAIEALSAAK
jgi:hypothetical protein